MIEFTKGDMFTVPVDVRINTVNCVGVMGAGVALAFKNRYPEMYKDYQKACREGMIYPGKLHIWKNLMGDWVINFPTKRDWRESSRYEDIADGLEALRTYLQEQGAVSIALPALGCGHGGLDWGVVSSMIQNKLGSLSAHIFVFEPKDSREVGRTSKERPSIEQIQELEHYGFKAIEQAPSYAGHHLLHPALVKGDERIIFRQWIALLPSKSPSERELFALEAVAREMALASEQVVVALVHTTKASEQIADVFLKNGVATVLILPFGPLSRKAIARKSTDNYQASFAMISLGAPYESWGKPILSRSMALLRSGATGVLLTDPEPTWLHGKSLRDWGERQIFYLRYETTPEDVRVSLNQIGARPIGRRSDTGTPNLSMLIQAGFSEAASQ